MQGFLTIHEARRFAIANGIDYVHEHEGLWFPCLNHEDHILHFGLDHNHEDAIEEVEHEHDNGEVHSHVGGDEEHSHGEGVLADIKEIEDIREDIEETEEELEELHDKLEEELEDLGHRFNENVD